MTQFIKERQKSVRWVMNNYPIRWWDRSQHLPKRTRQLLFEILRKTHKHLKIKPMKNVIIALLLCTVAMSCGASTPIVREAIVTYEPAEVTTPGISYVFKFESTEIALRNEIADTLMNTNKYYTKCTMFFTTHTDGALLVDLVLTGSGDPYHVTYFVTSTLAVSIINGERSDVSTLISTGSQTFEHSDAFPAILTMNYSMIGDALDSINSIKLWRLENRNSFTMLNTVMVSNQVATLADLDAEIQMALTLQ